MIPNPDALRIVLHAPTRTALQRARSNAANIRKEAPQAEVRIVANAEAVPQAIEHPDAAADALTWLPSSPVTSARASRPLLMAFWTAPWVQPRCLAYASCESSCGVAVIRAAPRGVLPACGSCYQGGGGDCRVTRGNVVGLPGIGSATLHATALCRTATCYPIQRSGASDETRLAGIHSSDGREGPAAPEAAHQSSGVAPLAFTFCLPRPHLIAGEAERARRVVLRLLHVNASQP